MGRGLVRAIIILGDMMCSKKRFIPVILQVACALAVLLGSSMSIAPTGPAQALFKTVNRFVLQLELFRENKRDIRWMVPFFSSKWSME